LNEPALNVKATDVTYEPEFVAQRFFKKDF